MEQQVLIISVGKPYSLTTDDGKNLSGCKMYYLPTTDLTTVSESESGLGYAPLIETMPYDFYERAKQVGIPCRAKLTLAMRTEKGKQVLKVVGLDFEQKGGK